MKILCLNAWGGTLHSGLLPFLQQCDPDVLCLQEVVHSPATAQPWLEYRDGDHVLPQRANLFQEVSSALQNHSAFFCPAAQGALWEDTHEVPSQWGLATFIKKSYPVIAQKQGFVHKAFSPYSYGEHPRSRNAHAVKVFDYEKNRSVCIAHMHGLRDLNGKMDTPERTEQALRFVQLTKEITDANDPLIVCGDFNVEPDSETLKILSDAGLTDLVTTRTKRGTRNSQYKKTGRYADYMLVNKNVSVAHFEVVFEPEVSDHCPLILTF